MKLLMISKDNKVLDSGSAVFARMKDLSFVFDELHIFVIGKAPKVVSIEQNNKLFVHNTTSSSFLISFWKVFWSTIRIGKKLEKKDLWITSQDPFETGLLSFVLSKILHCKLQLQIHTDFLSPFFKKESLLNWFRIFIAKLLIPKAQSIRVVSNRIKQSLIDELTIGLEKVIVLPVFIDTKKIIHSEKTFDLRKQFPEFKNIILIVARLEKEKNIDLSINAFALLVKQMPDVGLVICGEGSLKQSLLNLVSSLQIDHKVKFIGWIDDIYSAYRSSDCLLVTSSYEGYGMNMMEASILGLPVIATDVGIAEDVGAYITKKSVDSIIDGLKSNIQNTRGKRATTISILNKREYIDRFKGTFNQL